MKIKGKSVIDGIKAASDSTNPFVSLIIKLSIAVIVTGILLGVVLPTFDFGTLQATFDTLVEQIVNFTSDGVGYIIVAGGVALTLIVLAVVFIVFAPMLKEKGKGKNM